MSQQHEKTNQNRWNKLLTLVAAISFVAGIIFAIFKLSGADLLFGLSLAAGGIPVAISAMQKVYRRKISIHLLVTIAALGALYLGQFAEAAAVMFFSRWPKPSRNLARLAPRKPLPRCSKNLQRLPG